ncbi:TonB-dependent receptor, partial [Arthrospira platensis SPKY1]|nr:TonB-dependent receptor [Arthrospira platensis SPKY1]
PVSNPNPALRWERKAETNIGVDFSILDYKLTGTVDYYVRRTTDLLWRYSVPVPPNLFGETFANAGEIKTTGVEVTLGSKPISKAKFSWDVDFNIAFNRNELVSLSNEVYDFGTFRPIGNVGS